MILNGLYRVGECRSCRVRAQVRLCVTDLHTDNTKIWSDLCPECCAWLEYATKDMRVAYLQDEMVKVALGACPEFKPIINLLKENYSMIAMTVS